MGWHFPIVSGETASRWAENKFWVIYKEPACPQLRAALLEMDRLSRQKCGYVVGAFARPETAAEHQYYTWGVDSVQRFDDSGQRLVRAKKTQGPSRSPSPRRRDARSPPRWMQDSPP